jgi:hypothetical protein
MRNLKTRHVVVTGTLYHGPFCPDMKTLNYKGYCAYVNG